MSLPTSSARRPLRRGSFATHALACAALLGSLGSVAWAQAAAPGESAVPAHRVSFGVRATTEITRDWLTVTLQVMRDGADAALVQNGLKQVLEAALGDARRATQPGQLEVHTGNFSLNPRYNREGRPNGWTGTAELVLEGRDAARIASVAGRLAGMNIVGTGYTISRELRDKHQSELVARAIQDWRARASLIAREFGYAGYVLQDVNVSSGEAEGPRPVMMMRAAAAPMAEGAPLPTEAGTGTLSASVQGSIVLTR